MGPFPNLAETTVVVANSAQRTALGKLAAQNFSPKWDIDVGHVQSLLLDKEISTGDKDGEIPQLSFHNYARDVGADSNDPWQEYMRIWDEVPKNPWFAEGRVITWYVHFPTVARSQAQKESRC